VHDPEGIAVLDGGAGILLVGELRGRDVPCDVEVALAVGVLGRRGGVLVDDLVVDVEALAAGLAIEV
jgi:hypothetical protein